MTSKFKTLFFCVPFTVLFQQIGIAQNASSLHRNAKGVTPLFLSQKQWKSIPTHPRLFCNERRFEEIRNQNDTVTILLKRILKYEVDKILTSEPIVYPNSINNLNTGRAIQRQLINLAMAYQLFGDLRCLERAKKEILRTTELKNWGTGHFLDAAEISLGVGIAFDWLYENFTTEEREKVTKAISEKILLPSLAVKEGETHTTSWVNGNFNWNPVCHTGISVGALSIAEMAPQLAKQVVERAITNLPFAGEAYHNDGSFPEAPSYWSYGTSFFVMEIEALRSVFGHAYNLEKTPGLLKSADYRLQMQGSTGQDFNYSDYHAEQWNEPVMMWYARELSRKRLVMEELENIKKIDTDWSLAKQTNSHRLTAMELIWWNPKLPSNSNEQLSMNYTAQGGLPLGVMRTSWNDVMAGYLAIKGGTPNVSHGHMDVGSFVYEANGVRWAVDLGTEEYDTMRKANLDLWNYSQNSSRWSTFRVGADAHNIPRFDNAKQDVSGFAPIRQLTLNDGTLGNELDLSSLYHSQVEKITRTFKLFQDKSISIQDEWETSEKEVEYVFQWLTVAKVSIQEYGILLEQNGKKMKIHIEFSDTKIKPQILTEDVSKSKAIQDSDNPGVSRILIKIKSLAKTNYKLVIRAKSE